MELIENYFNENPFIWQSLPLFYQGNFSNIEKSNIKEVIYFFCNKLNFWYNGDLYEENPFGPMFDFTACGLGRSPTITDLTSDDVEKLESSLIHTNSEIILGFLYDVLGFINKNDENKIKASDYLLNYALKLIASQNRNFMKPIKRSLSLLLLTQEFSRIKNWIKVFFSELNLSDFDFEFEFKVDILNILFSKCPKLHKQIEQYCREIFFKFETKKSLYSIILAKINYKLAKNNNIESEIWLNRYVNLICNFENVFPEIFDEIDEAITIIDENSHFELLNRVRLKKEQLNSMFFTSFNMQTSNMFPFDENLVNQKQNEILSKFKSLNSINQFLYIISLLLPLNESQITEVLNKNENYLVNFINNFKFNNEHEIVFQSACASKTEILESNIYNIYTSCSILYCYLFVNPFMSTVTFDDKLHDLLSDILKHNELVTENCNVLIDSIEKAFNEKKIRSALSDIIPHFENGLRKYIRKQGIIPNIKNGKKDKPATLAQLFNNKHFRNIIDKLIGNDLTQFIDYLACKPIGSRVRNTYSHNGHGEDSECSVDETMLFFLILKAYCMACNNEL